MNTRQLSIDEAVRLNPGDQHYRAFVGPTERYDLIGATQFSLLFLLGMREHHRLLDFGCGSLRLGRLAIPYLRPGGYFGVEPEAWLVEEGFDRELGRDARAIKRPRFDYNREYRADVFGERFDFIVAQSIFSHTGTDASRRALGSFASVLADGGLVVANWLIGAETAELAPDDCDWVYPGCVPFEQARVERLAAEAGLAARRCPWPHPGGLTWFVMAKDANALPDEAQMARMAVAPAARP